MFDDLKGITLLHLARSAIAKELGVSVPDPPQTDWLVENGATFVTLTLHGQLRGCIGSVDIYRPLIEDLRQNAVASAYRDPRFPPLTKNELTDVIIEVSILSKPELIRHNSEENALSQLIPGRDGVIIEYGLNRATFLPQVWMKLTDPHDFISQLKLKADLPEYFWSDEIRILHYSVQKWREGEKCG